tara:strand:- start:339 stop:635 length:297 start_codon:yes stop_codon:yes gene_type:complete
MCGEPFDIGEFAYMARFVAEEATKIFRLHGCGVLWKMETNEEMSLEEAKEFECKPSCPEMAHMADVAAALGDIMGDDIDGMASELDGYCPTEHDRRNE